MILKLGHIDYVLHKISWFLKLNEHYMPLCGCIIVIIEGEGHWRKSEVKHRWRHIWLKRVIIQKQITCPLQSPHSFFLPFTKFHFINHNFLFTINNLHREIGFFLYYTHIVDTYTNGFIALKSQPYMCLSLCCQINIFGKICIKNKIKFVLIEYIYSCS